MREKKPDKSFKGFLMTKKPITKHNNDQTREKLYLAFLFINKLYKLEDLLKLKSKEFLNLCEVQNIDWNFSPEYLKKNFLTKKIKQKLYF